MKISHIESGRAAGTAGAAQAKILPKDRPRGLVTSKPIGERQLSPLEKGMAVAEAALTNIPDTRENIVNELKERIQRGEYKIDGRDVAEMMIRRLEADKIR